LKLPEFISLGGHRIKVVRQKGLISTAEAYGIFDCEQLLISLDGDLEGSLLWETFFHEIVEALNFFAEAELEHQTIQIFGLLLHQVVNSVVE